LEQQISVAKATDGLGRAANFAAGVGFTTTGEIYSVVHIQQLV
jgi:hypothetical protein